MNRRRLYAIALCASGAVAGFVVGTAASSNTTYAYTRGRAYWCSKARPHAVRDALVAKAANAGALVGDAAAADEANAYYANDATDPGNAAAVASSPQASLEAALAAFRAPSPGDPAEDGGEAFGLLVAPDSARVARVHVVKHTHRMELLDAYDGVLARYRVAIGGGGRGPKWREGAKTTPEGRYHVLRRNSHRDHNFLLLDYPNEQDKERFAEAKRKHQLPWWTTIGSAVGIHGGTRDNWIVGDRIFDWTNGCVAVKDSEIDAIDALVPDGTEVDIED
jgi:hypothetical protein